MSEQIKLTRDEFKAKLAEITARQDGARAAAEPYREALRPFEEAENAILDERIEFIEAQEDLGAFSFRCLDCGAPIFGGEPSCAIGDEGYVCEQCAPTLAEAIEGFEGELEFNPGDKDILESIANLRARITGGESPDAQL